MDKQQGKLTPLQQQILQEARKHGGLGVLLFPRRNGRTLLQKAMDELTSSNDKPVATLHADKDLAPETAEALGRMIQIAHDTFSKKEAGQ